MRINLSILFALGILIIVSCGEESYIPKPATYLRLDFPERNYQTYSDDCGYSFDVPSYFSMKPAAGSPCNKDVDFGPLNGVMYLSYIEMDTIIDTYIDYVYNKVGEHKIKATNIEDTTFLMPDKKVFGTLFELQGNVATPIQFYVTDSTDRFLSGIVYFNSVPNYDSLKPVLQFVKRDIVNMITTAAWQ